MKTSIKALLATAIVAGCVVACSKENSADSSGTSVAGKQSLSIYMMDDPVPFTKVLIDIRQVAVKIDTAAHREDGDDDHQWNDDYDGCKHGHSAIWDTLSIKPGVYDLLKLRNGTDSLLSSGLVPNGKVLQVRITLGSDNSIYTDSVTHYPLNIVGTGNTFNVNVKKEDINVVDNSHLKIWFDFNLSRSIFFYNGKYWLKPMLTPFNDQQRPKLEGRVLPEGAAGFVAVFNQQDTTYALPWNEGYYQVRGLKAGNYSIYFKGIHGYKDSTVTVTVAASGLTKAATVTLHK